MKTKKVRFNLKKSVLTAAFLAAAAQLCANNLPFAHDISVKNAGSSGALSPFVSGAFSPHVNPAGLGGTERQEISGLYYNLFMGGLLSSVSYALPLLDAGAIGASMMYFNSGSIAGVDANNQPSGLSYSESYVNFFLSYGILLFSSVNCGLTLKYLNHNLADYSNSAYGLDLGAVALLPFDIRISAFVENAIKPEFTYRTFGPDILPVYFDATASWSYSIAAGLKDSFKIGAGFSKEEYDPSWGWHAGAEYSVYEGLAALRAGMSGNGFSFGLSMSHSGASFDYAYTGTSYDFLHRFSLSYSFGQNIRALEAGLKTKEDRLKYELVQKIREDALAEFRASIKNSLASGDAEAALITVQKALVWAPYDEWFRKQEQDINVMIGKEKKERLLLEADRLIKEDSYIDALVALRNVLDMDPANTDAKIKFDRAAQFVKALGEKNMSVETGNKDAIKQYFEKGLDMYASGQYEKAVSEWDMVIQASPLQHQVYEMITKAKEKIRKKEDQEKNIGILRQQKISALYNEAVMLHTRGKFEESINIWREILRLDPVNAEAREYLRKVTEEYKKIQRQNLEW